MSDKPVFDYGMQPMRSAQQFKHPDQQPPVPEADKPQDVKTFEG